MCLLTADEERCPEKIKFSLWQAQLFKRLRVSMATIIVNLKNKGESFSVGLLVSSGVNRHY